MDTPATQVGALTGNRTDDLLVCGMMLNKLRYTGQGRIHLIFKRRLYYGVSQNNEFSIYYVTYFVQICQIFWALLAHEMTHPYFSQDSLHIKVMLLVLFFTMFLMMERSTLP